MITVQQSAGNKQIIAFIFNRLSSEVSVMAHGIVLQREQQHVAWAVKLQVVNPGCNTCNWLAAICCYQTHILVEYKSIVQQHLLLL